MSASTQGTPSWLLRLEQAKDQLKLDNYITWLLTRASDYDIPDEVIQVQLEASGYSAMVEDAVTEELQPPQEEAKRKAGRPRKQLGEVTVTTDYNDGTIHGWNGGDCPIHKNSEVTVWLRGRIGDTRTAGSMPWLHSTACARNDIIAFRVDKSYKEPRTIWVNEYGAYDLYYTSSFLAEQDASSNCLRIAVKYQEVIE